MRAHAQTYAQTGKQKDDRLIDIHTDRHKQTGSRMLSRQVHIQESICIGLYTFIVYENKYKSTYPPTTAIRTEVGLDMNRQVKNRTFIGAHMKKTASSVVALLSAIKSTVW